MKEAEHVNLHIIRAGCTALCGGNDHSIMHLYYIYTTQSVRLPKMLETSNKAPHNATFSGRGS